MNAGQATEDAWLSDAFRHFTASDRVVLGLGHDVAAVRVTGGRGEAADDAGGGVAVLTTDVLVGGVHFDAAATPEEIAYKALAINISDLAAAAAHPLGFLIGAVLPRPVERALFDGLMRGFARAAGELGCPCLGGDTNTADGPLVLSVTAVGEPGPMGVVSRAGARVGDLLSVTGPLGGSLAGRHLRPRPRVSEALALAEAGVPHAMMDLSDGLSRDLPRLCRASGVGARIDAAHLPLHADARGTPARTPLEQGLHDGEDFELLLSHAPLDQHQRESLRAAGVVLHAIGRVSAPEQGIVLVSGTDTAPLVPLGYDHLGG